MPLGEDNDTQSQVDMTPPISQDKGKRAGKGKGKPAKADQGKRSINLSLDVDVYERLAVHAMRQTRGNISELVSQLARDHLREFHITRTATRPSGE